MRAGGDLLDAGKEGAATRVDRHMNPRERAWLSLEGLSIGDAFGEQFFGPPHEVRELLAARTVPSGRWRWTDDTEMAISIVHELAARGALDQDALAEAFADRMDPSRGYGASAYTILNAIREGIPWRRASASAFRGRGSFGNGSAMRVAPLGAFHADDLEKCIAEARASAEITHMHEEGIAGAIAVSVAAALTWRRRGHALPNGRAWLTEVRSHVPKGYVRDGIDAAIALAADVSAAEAAGVLGNGAGVTTADTVPFCLWISAWYSHDFVEAMWQTVSAFGDRDTTCAIVGGIVALQVGEEGLPSTWQTSREALPLPEGDESRPV